MSLNITAIAYILEVARSGSISRAAQELFVSQPHLSHTIRSIEEQLGVVIFKRSAKGVVLTDRGKTFVRYAQPIVSQAKVLETMFCQTQDESLKINLSVTRSYQVLKCVTNFINAHPEKNHVNIRFKETNPFEVIEDVCSGESEIGLLHYYETQEKDFLKLMESKNIMYNQFYDREFLLVMSADNPLAQKGKVEKEMLEHQKVVLYGDYETSWLSYQGVMEMADVVMSHKRIYVYDRGSAMDILSRCPDTYMWITGLNRETLEQYNLVLKRCAGVNVRNKGVLIRLRGIEPTAVGDALFDAMKEIDWTELIVD